MSTALARRFVVEATTDLTLAGGWVEIGAVNDFTYKATPTLEDASAYDTDGYGSVEKTFEEWTASVTAMCRETAGVQDAGQALVETRTIGQWGDNARVGLRWYDRNGGPKAYQGVAIVVEERGATGVKNLDSVKYDFTGTDVPLRKIANPGVAATKPIVLSATPTAQTVGKTVRIGGTGFTGTIATTGVKFGAVSASDWQVLSDQLIVAVMPAGSAGSAPVVVTNAVGASDPFPYTRGA